MLSNWSLESSSYAGRQRRGYLFCTCIGADDLHIRTIPVQNPRTVLMWINHVRAGHRYILLIDGAGGNRPRSVGRWSSIYITERWGRWKTAPLLVFIFFSVLAGLKVSVRSKVRGFYGSFLKFGILKENLVVGNTVPYPGIEEGRRNWKQVSGLVASSMGCHAVSSLSLAGLCDFALHSPSWTLTRGQNWNEEFCFPSSLTVSHQENHSHSMWSKDKLLQISKGYLHYGHLLKNSEVWLQSRKVSAGVAGTT